MGFRLSWVAIHGKSRDEIHRVLAITATGTYEEFPESPCTGALLSDGWYLVVKNCEFFKDCGFFDNDEQLSKLSDKCVVIMSFVHEGIMVSYAAEWRNGKRIWSTLHNSQKALDHFEARGELPSTYNSIRQQLETKQAEHGRGVDYIFDIPVEIAKSITGYRHDAIVTTVDERGFEVLRIDEPPPNLSWFHWVLRKF